MAKKSFPETQNSKRGKPRNSTQSCSCYAGELVKRSRSELGLGGSVSSTDSATSNNNKTNNAALSMNWFGKKKDGGGGSSSAPSGGGGGGGGGGDPALTIVRLREAVATQEKR